jgi:hypothetical protein
MGLFRNLWRGRKPERREPVSRDYEPASSDARGRGRAFGPEDYRAGYRGRHGLRPGPRDMDDHADAAVDRASYCYAGETRGTPRHSDFEPDSEPAPRPRAGPMHDIEAEAERVRDRRRTVERERGHRGRGPRGYRRSDERILEDICDRLTEDPLIDATDIEVTVKNSEATLDGTVTDRLSRRRAEDIADCVSGVVVVVNNLRIERRVRQMADELDAEPRDEL